VYSGSGVGVQERQYYCIDKARNSIIHKLKSVPHSMFHEFIHCLHHIEDGCSYGRDRIPTKPEDELWTSKEECRTIAGYINRSTYDPICDNCFHLYEVVAEPLQLYQQAGVKSTAFRLTVAGPTIHHVKIKRIQYYPRLGHIGYVKGRQYYSIEKLQTFYISLNFDLAWPMVYMVP
jgi:hypothetical protein